MNNANSYGAEKDLVISVRVSEDFNARAIHHARHVLGYRDLSSFVRDAVEEKISSSNPHLNARLRQIERNLNRIAGVIMRFAGVENILPPRSQRKIAKLLERSIEDTRGALYNCGRSKG